MKRKLLIAFVFIFLLFPLSNGNSEEKKVSRLNGYMWANMDTSEKIGFVKGWYIGGAEVVTGLLLYSIKPIFTSKTKRLRVLI